MRRRLSVELPCLNSSHNCLCCVLDKAGVQSKYFQAERGLAWLEEVLMLFGFKTVFENSLEDWRERKKNVLIKLKGLSQS